MGLGSGFPVDAAYDVLGHGPSQRGIRPAVTRHLGALLSGIEHTVVVPVDPAGDCSPSVATGVEGDVLARSGFDACGGDGDTVLVVAVPAVVVIAVGPVAEMLLGLGVDQGAQVGSGGVHAGGVDETAAEEVVAVAARDLTAVPLGLQESRGAAVGSGGIPEVGGQDQPQGDGGVAGSLHGDGGASRPFHEHGHCGPADAVGLGVASAVLVDALLRRVVQPQGAVPVGQGRAGSDRPPGASSRVGAVVGAPAVEETPGDSLVVGDLGLDPLAVEGLIGAPGVGGLGVGEDQAVEAHRRGAAVGGLEGRRAGDVEADARVSARGGAVRPAVVLVLAVPGLVPVVGVAVGQSDDHPVVVGVVVRVLQAVVPLRAAVTPPPGAPDVVEVVEDVAGPGTGNGGDQRATSKIVRKPLLMAKVLEIGQVAGGD